MVGVLLALWLGKLMKSHAASTLKCIQDHSIGHDRLPTEDDRVLKGLLEESIKEEKASKDRLEKSMENIRAAMAATKAEDARFNVSIAKVMKEMPSKTLRTIQGSLNNTTGKLGEMMTLIELQQAYDRLIVVGDIVDFIGVKFPVEDNPGGVYFIDVKTGKGAALSADQRKFKKLVESKEGLFEFKVVKVQIT
tara:strand:+ start:112 stop:690 length:579 start_codon:yes stop_codon:yes gene_type:complete